MMIRELYTTLKFENRKMNALKWFICNDKGGRMAGPFDSKAIAEKAMATLKKADAPVKEAEPKAEAKVETKVEAKTETKKAPAKKAAAKVDVKIDFNDE